MIFRYLDIPRLEKYMIAIWIAQLSVCYHVIFLPNSYFRFDRHHILNISYHHQICIDIHHLWSVCVYGCLLLIYSVFNENCDSFDEVFLVYGTPPPTFLMIFKISLCLSHICDKLYTEFCDVGVACCPLKKIRHDSTQ